MGRNGNGRQRRCLAWHSEEQADYLKTTEDKLERLRRTGLGPPFIKLGHHVRYRAAATEIWLDAQTRTHSRQTKAR